MIVNLTIKTIDRNTYSININDILTTKNLTSIIKFSLLNFTSNTNNIIKIFQALRICVNRELENLFYVFYHL